MEKHVYCKYCGMKCVKCGLQKNGKQRFVCKDCMRRQQTEYHSSIYDIDIDNRIVDLTTEGVGIRSTARILKISITTLLRRIIIIAKQVKFPPTPICHSFEVDEMWSFIKRKSNPIWIAYALDRETKRVVAFNVGSRSREMLKPIITTLTDASAQMIYTDSLKQYRSLVPNYIHDKRRFRTNHIERHNLTIRTHIKRLSRRTICFSRNQTILIAILAIYFTK